MTNQQIINDLMERVTHSDTMRSLSPLETEWLLDTQTMLDFMTDEEREAWYKAELHF